MNILYSLQHLGSRSRPRRTPAGVGGGRPGPLLPRRGQRGTGERLTNRSTAFMTWNLVHAAGCCSRTAASGVRRRALESGTPASPLDYENPRATVAPRAAAEPAVGARRSACGRGARIEGRRPHRCRHLGGERGAHLPRRRRPVGGPRPDDGRDARGVRATTPTWCSGSTTSAGRRCPGCRPNAAHQALARLEQALGDDLLLVTQNVDDLHERAGSERVLHMHGRLAAAWCTACDARHEWHGPLAHRPPCPDCGSRSLRPDVVWFGEIPYEMDRIERALEACDLFVAIGTSGTVYPAAAFVHWAAGRHARAQPGRQPRRRRLRSSPPGPGHRAGAAWVDELLGRRSTCPSFRRLLPGEQRSEAVSSSLTSALQLAE